MVVVGGRLLEKRGRGRLSAANTDRLREGGGSSLGGLGDLPSRQGAARETRRRDVLLVL